MLFRVRCPRCGQTAEISQEHLGRQGQCNNCGSLVAIPARLNKVCFVCGVDVTHISHTKDENGNYRCTNCLLSSKPAEQSIFSSPKLECSICHVQFPPEQAGRSLTGPICPQCDAVLEKERSAEGVIPFATDIPSASEQDSVQHEHEMQPTATALVEPPTPDDFEQIQTLPRRAPDPIAQIFPEAFPNRAPALRLSQAHRLPLILSSIALVGVIILAVHHFSSHLHNQPPSENPAPAQQSLRDNPDQETLTRVLVLKGQAEVLLDVGKPREAIDKYDAVLRIQSFNSTIAAEIDSAKLAREKALKLLAASSTPSASTERVISEPDQPKKSRTIFDDK